ncbi:MAG: PEP-CTERM sorting domain-containing protein [Gemmatirosa sp.]
MFVRRSGVAGLLVTVAIGTAGALGALAPHTAEAQGRLGLVRGNYTDSDLTYGTPGWSRVTGAINTAFGGAANVEVLDALTDPDLAGVDALWLDLRRQTNTLSIAERSVFEQFVATGRRVVVIGENIGWQTWNASFLAPLGGSFGGQQAGVLGVALAHPLTDGLVTGFRTSGAGRANGGTSLFTANVATLWGSTQNVLTILDASALDDGDWFDPIRGGDSDQARFVRNASAWVATPTAVVPEPSTWLLVGTGVVALAGVSLRRRSQG